MHTYCAIFEDPKYFLPLVSTTFDRCIISPLHSVLSLELSVAWGMLNAGVTMFFFQMCCLQTWLVVLVETVTVWSPPLRRRVSLLRAQLQLGCPHFFQLSPLLSVFLCIKLPMTHRPGTPQPHKHSWAHTHLHSLLVTDTHRNRLWFLYMLSNQKLSCSCFSLARVWQRESNMTTPH